MEDTADVDACNAEVLADFPDDALSFSKPTPLVWIKTRSFLTAMAMVSLLLMVI
jgi:hypothetical protein